MKVLRFLFALFLAGPVGLFLCPVRASITSTTARVSYTISSLPATLPVTYPFNFASGAYDLIVYDGGALNTANSPPVQLTYASDYTVTGGGYNSQNQLQTGNVVVVGGGSNSVQVGDVITILRNTPLTQTTTFSSTGFMTPLMIEAGFDKLTTETQQLTNIQSGVLRFQPNENISGILPYVSRIGTGATGTVLGFDTNGNLKFYPVPASVTPITTGVLNQLTTGQFYSSSGASINRANDRLFIGGATASDAKNPEVASDWVSIFYNANGYTAWQTAGDLAVETNTNVHDNNAIFAAARSLNNTGAAQSTIGIMSTAVNNNAGFATPAWAIYAEGQTVHAGVGETIVAEFSSRSLFATIDPTPYAQGSQIGLQLSSGAGVTAVGQFDNSCAIEIVKNPMKWHKGLVFGSDSLSGDDGVTGLATAIALGRGHTIQWYSAGGVGESAIYSTVDAGAQSGTDLAFSNGGAAITDYQGGNIANFSSSATLLTDYFNFSGGINASNLITLAALGTDTNISMLISPKGTGTIGIGGVQTTNNLSILHTVPAGSARSSVEVYGAFAAPAATDLHPDAYRDSSVYTSAVDADAYASYDALPQLLGTHAYNHFIGYQARNGFGGSGTLGRLEGFSSFMGVSSGTVTEARAFYVPDLSVTGGTVTHYAGLYVDQLTAGTTRHAIYIAGTDKLFMAGGQICSSALLAPIVTTSILDLTFDQTVGTQQGVAIKNKNATNTGHYVDFYNSSTVVQGSITQTNSTTTAYNTSSDARLKENIRDMPDSGKIVDGMKPRLFDWKWGGKNYHGFIAQELEEVFPEAVTKGETWSVDYSKVTPVLTAEVKGLRSRVSSLERTQTLLFVVFGLFGIFQITTFLKRK